MGSFAASLKALGDTTGLPATVSVSDGVLSISAASQNIGNWDLKDIRLEPVPLGYRMTAEGDQIVIEMTDVDGFAEAISAKKRRFRRSTKTAKVNDKTLPADSKQGGGGVAAAVSPAVPRASDTGIADVSRGDVIRRPEMSPKPPAVQERQEKARTWEVVLRGVDGAIEAAESRFGTLLPHWVFTRMMFGVVVVSLILAIIFPTAVSLFLLISGLLIVVLGAVVYTDPMLMAKWLPGRMQPMHVLLFGVIVLLLGVLLGVLAN